MSLRSGATERRWARWSRVVLAALAVAGAVACSRNPQPEIEDGISRDPIVVHVKNENFLDMNMYAVSSGATRRLGTVTGNGSGEFSVPWSFASASGIVIVAQPIGSRGSASSPSLNVGPGQVVEFKVGSTLRLSTATVHDPQ